MPYCDKCGSQIDNNTNFCMKCGNRIQAMSNVNSPSAQLLNSQNIDNHLVKAILVTLFCCLPAGIVSIIYASSVNSKLSRGDMLGAFEASKKANFWANLCLIGFIPMIMVIGILSAIAIPAYSDYTKKAQVVAVTLTMDQVQNAQVKHYNSTGKWLNLGRTISGIDQVESATGVKVARNYIKDMKVKAGTVCVTFNNEILGFEGKTLTLIIDAEGMSQWCKNDPEVCDCTIDKKYVPK